MGYNQVEFFKDGLVHIPKAALRIDEVLLSQYVLDERLVRVIHPGMGGVPAESLGDIAKHLDKCVKVESFEKLNQELFTICRRIERLSSHPGPVTCHLFVAPAGSLSFPMHTDPDDVIVHIVEGEKTMLVGDESYVLRERSSLFIPHGTPHQAINHHASVMLSFGLERFLVEKLDL